MAVCKKCSVEKLPSEFYSDGKGKTKSTCKICYNKNHKIYRDGDAKEKIKVSWKNASKKYQSNPKIQHKRRLKRYNISDEEYIKMFDDQQGKCKICAKNITLVIDHCHKTNTVRGLICNSCNLLIGYAQNNVEILQSAINYLNCNYH